MKKSFTCIIIKPNNSTITAYLEIFRLNNQFLTCIQLRESLKVNVFL